MGIDIVGRDINPLVCDGSRENIAYFGLTGDVKKSAIEEIVESYDVAIIDLPYNLYTHAIMGRAIYYFKACKKNCEKSSHCHD